MVWVVEVLLFFIDDFDWFASFAIDGLRLLFGEFGGYSLASCKEVFGCYLSFSDYEISTDLTHSSIKVTLDKRFD